MPASGPSGSPFLVASEAGGWSGEGPAWHGESRSAAAPRGAGGGRQLEAPTVAEH